MSKKAQDPPIKKNAFVHKLYTMLSDPKISHLIWWSDSGESNTFALFPGKEFADALTGYFKHGNVASFVRQLHMYGFHKVSEPTSTSNMDKDTPSIWEFKHSSGKFRKGDESSLIYIKRRSSSNSSRNSYNGNQQGHSHSHHHEYGMHTSSPSPSTYDIHGQYYSGPPPPQQPQSYIQYYGANGAPIPPPHPHMHTTVQAVQIPHTLPLPKHGDPSVVSVPYGYSYPPQQVYGYPQYAPQNSYIQQPQPLLQHQYPQQQQQQQQLPPPPPQMRQTPPIPLSPSTKRNNSDPVNSTQTPTTIKVQHYSPNLQFRKIWENNNSNQNAPGRPRNPSLLFDPLAPAPPQESQYLQQPQQPRQHLTHMYQPYQSLSRHNSSTSTYSKESFSSTTESLESRSSIKLPPPSSIHRSSSSTVQYPKSPEPPREESPVPVPIPTSSAAVPRSIPTNFEASPVPIIQHPTSSSLPNSPSGMDAKRPSLLHGNGSLQDRLRPSLIELYYGNPQQTNSNSNSATTANNNNNNNNHNNSTASTSSNNNRGSLIRPHDSIGSQSSHNSIFSNQSSLSSISSFQRASSFGSISHQVPDQNGKISISVSPHDQVSARTSDLNQSITSKPSSIIDPSDVKLPPYRSLTPPLNSGIKSTTLQRQTSIPVMHRSLTSSPLSKTSHESFDKLKDSLKTDVNKKVSVESLLDDSNGKTADVSPLVNIEENESDSTVVPSSADADIKRRKLV
ncbi:HSF-type DNA-binding-domain-containing protein [Scheffersomyces coipomensis]|uniref:HSF-type DNA-binding-domain-containing protein n=1 Tax=Scheffersomyces coipomensis TaxID=1788519 RepID=UPI00315D6A80